MPFSVTLLNLMCVRRRYAKEFDDQISEVNSTAICQCTIIDCSWLKYSVMYNCHHKNCGC